MERSPREYQTRAIDATSETMKSKRAVLLIAPCGAGKTFISATIMKRTIAKGRRCVFFADAVELVEQTSDHLSELGIPYGENGGHGLIWAGSDYMPELPIQVASVQTWDSWFRQRSRKEKPHFDLAIFDEAQSSTAFTRRELLAPFKYRIGLSATPATGKGKGLGVQLDDGSFLWDAMVNVVTYSELLAGGFLVPIKAYAPSIPDLRGATTNSDGDYSMNDDLISRVSTKEIIGNVIEHWKRFAADRISILFACNLKHSLFMREQFRSIGVPAEHIDGNTPPDERKDILRRLRSGDVKVLCNFKVFGRGVDVPIASCAINCRPFGNIVGWRQAMSRVQRSHPGKTDALLIDHTASLFKFGYPDEDIPWPLHEDDTSPQEALQDQWEKKSKTEKKQIVCPKCSAYREGGKVCPACGYTYEPRGKDVKHVPGSLESISRERVKKSNVSHDMQKTWSTCLAIAANRGGTVASALAMFRSKTSQWPTGLSPEIAPDKRDIKVSILYPGFVKRKGDNGIVASTN